MTDLEIVQLSSMHQGTIHQGLTVTYCSILKTRDPYDSMLKGRKTGVVRGRKVGPYDFRMDEITESSQDE